MKENCNKKKKLIVSMTSHPPRIGGVSPVLSTIFAQTMQPDEVLLYLAKEQFPSGEQDLPSELKALVNKGRVTIRWCDDLKPHKKYYYAFQDFKDDLIITVDDDTLYPPEMIETLYNSYQHFPNSVSANSVKLVLFTETDGLLSYRSWPSFFREIPDTPTMQLVAIGCDGVLYPSSLFQSELLLDRRAIMDNCPYADDIWLKLYEITAEIPVVYTGWDGNQQILADSYKTALWNTNKYENEEQWQKGAKWWESQLGGATILQHFKKDPTLPMFRSSDLLISLLKKRGDFSDSYLRWVDELVEAKAWYLSQIENKDKRIQEQEAWIQELKQAKEWLEDHYHSEETRRLAAEEALKAQTARSEALEQKLNLLKENKLVRLIIKIIN